MKTRPKLKPGDICVLSKSARKCFKYLRNTTFVVIEVGSSIRLPRVSRPEYNQINDSSNGRCSVVITCKTKINHGCRWWKMRMERRNLYLVKQS